MTRYRPASTILSTAKLPGKTSGYAGGVRFRGGLMSVLVAVTALGLAACGTGDTDASTASSPSRLLAPADFAERVADPAWTVINVHVPFEGAIAGTDLRIPFDQIEQQQARLPDPAEASIAVYCMSSSMSADAARTLQTMGYTNIVELKGGMQAWQASGRQLLDKPQVE